MLEFSIIAEKLLAAVIVAVPTSLLSVHLALKKYRNEKWWDKRLTYHLDTISALNDVILYCDYSLDVVLNEVDRTEGQIDELSERFHKANVHLQAQVNISSLLYSSDICSALRELNSGMFSAERETDKQKQLGCLRVSAENCLSQIVESARRDLGVK